ncbi:Gfo/Idh/MocA family oxidoreductase [candidate division KSB1 bacterium]|nr:Gfo/Idh/MocA family oxidoreductase [candidate division KSB1 bacterium]MBL7095194.1 Gfo/Idh/MocA family oxidoreductase [candidate division KSB1 bacterium]
MLNKIKIGILGVGHLGRFHTQNYNQIPEAEIVGVYDLDQKRGKQIADEFHVAAFENLDSLLDKVEAVSIVVPTVNHFDITKACLERGIHCLVEKPITSTLEQADALIKLSKEKKAILQVGHIERFNPAILALEDLHLNPMFIESHRLASFNPRGTDVAVVLDLMIHDIDIILHLVKSPVKKIDASGVAVISDEVDIANARMTFENGGVANVTASRISQKAMRKMRIFQRNAYIGIDFLQKFSEVYRLVDSETFRLQPNQFPIELGQIDGSNQPQKIVYERKQVEEANALKMELETFLDSVKTRKKPAVTGEDGREALRVAIEITEMIRQQLNSFTPLK